MLLSLLLLSLKDFLGIRSFNFQIGCNLKLSTLKEFFELNDMEQSLNAKESIATSDLMKILKELFLFEIKSGGNIPVSPILASDLMLNWLANVHDG